MVQLLVLVFGSLTAVGTYMALTNQTFVDNATDAIDLVKEAVPSLYNFFVSVKDFLGNMIAIFPSPFDSLISVFLVLLFSLFLWKLIKGGG